MHLVRKSDPIDTSTVLALSCLALLAASYVALGAGLLRLLHVGLPVIARLSVVGL